MRKFLCLTGMLLGLMFLSGKLMADPVYLNRSSELNGIKIYHTGTSATVTDVVRLYTVGGSTTTEATYTVADSSIIFTTAGGLYPGSSSFYLLDTGADTLTELCALVVAASTYTVGLEGGVSMSTMAAAYGYIPSSYLTVIGTTSCITPSTCTLTATPAASQTATVDVQADTLDIVTTNGLYPGTYQYTFASTTLAEMETTLEALAATTSGIDGTIVCEIDPDWHEDNLATGLTETNATNFLLEANEQTLAMTTVYGIRYIIPASASKNMRIVLNNINVNATFASGSTTITIYDGNTTSAPILRKYTVPTTAVDCDKIIEGDELRGSPGNTMMIDVVGTVAISAGYLNFTYKYQR